MGSSAIARLRKAADNQAALGESEFHLPIMDMCRLVQQASEEMGRGWLPRDADGEAVPLYVKGLYRADGTEVEVDCYMRDPADGEWRVLDTTGTMAKASELHVQRPEPDSWERLENDVHDALNDGGVDYRDEHDLEYTEDVAGDVIRRAKKLAGVDE